MNSHEAEMHTAVHDLLAERRALRNRIQDLELELQVAQQMTHVIPTGTAPIPAGHVRVSH